MHLVPRVRVVVCRSQKFSLGLAGAAAGVTWTDLLALAPGREDLSTLG